MLETNYMNKFMSLILVTLVFYIMLSLYYTRPNTKKYKELTPSFHTNHIFDLELHYVISNNCTDDNDIKVIQIVTSFSGNMEVRSAQRRAYSHTELRQLGIYRVFLLAMLKPGTSNVTQEMIQEESDKYNDIVQGNFLDDYRNLTYKHIMGIRWAVTECVAPLIIKMDDDIAANLYSLMEVIESKKDTSYDLIGILLNNTEPKRKVDDKWYVTREEYQPNIYPPYESGWLYVLKNHAANEILYALQSEKFFWIDDVFVTGMLAQKANLILKDIRRCYTIKTEGMESCIRDKVKCKCIAGASMGDNNIIVDFQRHSKTCHITNCSQQSNVISTSQ